MNQKIKARRRAQLARRDRKAVNFIAALLNTRDRLCSASFGSVTIRVVCRNGFSVSIQASSGHYCTPRSSYGPWETVELGYPSSHPGRRIAAYGECMSSSWPTDTVYAYVPVRLVHDLLRKHGGVKR